MLNDIFFKKNNNSGTDTTTTPPEHAAYYDEKFLLIHGSYMLNNHRESRPEALEIVAQPLVKARAAAGGGMDRGGEGWGGAMSRRGLGQYLRAHGSALFYFDSAGQNK